LGFTNRNRVADWDRAAAAKVISGSWKTQLLYQAADNGHMVTLSNAAQIETQDMDHDEPKVRTF
jgi:hypothetical protein